MAKNGADCELPQRRLSAKEKHNMQYADSLSLSERKQRDREERGSLVLWKKPLVTLHYFLLELRITLKDWMWGFISLCLSLSWLTVSLSVPCVQYVQHMEKRFLWCAYWVGLGILSSVGLGTGLHTFLLYLSQLRHMTQHSCFWTICSSNKAFIYRANPLFTHPLNPSTHTAGTALTAGAWGGGVPGHKGGGDGGRGEKGGGREALVCVPYYSNSRQQQAKSRDLQTTMLLLGLWLGYSQLTGPHIASVTLAAYECGSVDFPEPPYPEQIICPQEEVLLGGTAAAVQGGISLWTIVSKVRLEACMWGAGTAIGELPPYFMARAARLSGEEPDDEEYEEFGELLEQAETPQDFATRAKLAVQKMVQRVGFFGILACASIPNPLFDLAGITCGHFLVPFWTFFGATLIGKAIIKMHI
ncbi:unnamed protein product, partial [Coregonus sp. 'balchen']